MQVGQYKSLVAAVLLAGSFAAMSAHAEGVYAGGSLGVPHFGSNVNGVSADGGSGVSGKLFGGYQLTPNVAVEAGIADLGHVHEGNSDVSAHGQYVDAVGLLPVGHDVSLLGSVGAAHVKMDTSKGNDAGTALKLGLGAEYALEKNVSLRGEWEQYRPAVFGEHPTIDQYSVGVRVGF